MRPFLACSAVVALLRPRASALLRKQYILLTLNKVTGWKDSQHWWLASLKQNNSIKRHTENLFFLWLPAGVVQEQHWSPAFSTATCLKPHVLSCCALRRAERQQEAYPCTPAEQCPVVGLLSCCSREGFQNVSLNHEIWDPNSTLPWICVQLPQIALESKTQPPEPSIQRAGTDYCLWDNICFNQLVWYTRMSNKTSGVVQLWRKSSSYPLLCCKPSDSHSVSVALYCHIYCLLVCWCKGVKHGKPVPF